MMNLPLIMFSMERTLITRAIRFILSLLDNVIYYFVSVVFQAIFDISNMPFETKILGSLTGKVYIILSVFMFFKIAISLISYLVNPDTISDKQVGVGKLSLRVVITLIALIALPAAFDELMSTTLNEGMLETLPRLIIGTDSVDQKSLGTNGDYIAWNVLNGFVHNNKECPTNADLTVEIKDDAIGTTDDYEMTNIFGVNKSKATVVLENINLECDGDADMYYYDYTPLISTIAGGFLLYVLIGIAINVGVRAFKLMILRLVAPIPIISYIDPKSGKDGAFNKWLKMIGKVWVELYIHLSIVYFVVFLLKEMINGKESKFVTYISDLHALGLPGDERAIYLVIFLVLGLFFFAKQAPKFISESLGLKSDSFGDIFKMAGAGVGVGAAIGGMVGATAGSLGRNFKQIAADSKSAQNGWERAGAWARGALRLPGNAITGIGSGVAGGWAALNSDKGQLKAANEARKKYMNARNYDGKNLFSDVVGAGQEFVGYDLDKEIQKNSKIATTAKGLREFANSEGAKYYSNRTGMGVQANDVNNTSRTMNYSYDDVLRKVQEARVNGTNVTFGTLGHPDYVDFGSVDGAAVEGLLNSYKEAMGDQLMTDVDSGASISGSSDKDNAIASTLGIKRNAYANASGTPNVKSQRNSTIKKNQKQAETNQAALEAKKIK